MRSKVGTMELVKHIREEMQYEVFFVSYEYPSDHLLVPLGRLGAFREQVGGVKSMSMCLFSRVVVERGMIDTTLSDSLQR